VRPPLPPPDVRAAPGKPGWCVDERTGCWVWNASLRLDQTVQWSEGCSPVGRATGRGILEWRTDGKMSRYEGEFRDGKPNGQGVTTMASGQRLVGEFRDGVMHGRGVFTSASGNRFEGKWRDGRANGYGVYKQKDGEVYKGEWVDGCFRKGETRIAVGRPASQCR